MKFEADKINLDGLEELQKLLRKNKTKIKVGILGKQAREVLAEDADNDAPDNATVGLWHEMGSETVDQRSWLRMPLIEKLYDKLSDSKALDKKTMDKVIREKSFTDFAKKIALVAEECIQEAFDTGGFGKWKPSKMRGKKVQQTLVETQQLRNSVTSEVK